MSGDLRRAFGHFATGVTVITAKGGQGRLAGVTANSFSSLSLDPPLVLWSLAKTSSNYDVFTSAHHFVVHVLDSSQAALARHFSARAADRLSGVELEYGDSGVPMLKVYHARFECETTSLYEGGDHTILVGRVQKVREQPGHPLLFYRGSFASVHPLS